MLKNLQKTIKDSIELQGVGLHNGKKVNICLKPAAANFGIKFKRTDVDSAKNIISGKHIEVWSDSILQKMISGKHIEVWS